MEIKVSSILYFTAVILSLFCIILIPTLRKNGYYNKTLLCGYNYLNLGTLVSNTIIPSNINADQLYRTSDSLPLTYTNIIANIVMKLTINYPITPDSTRKFPYYLIDNNSYGISVEVIYKSVALGTDISQPIILYSGTGFLLNYEDNTITFTNSAQKSMSDVLVAFMPTENFTMSFIIRAYSLANADIIQPLSVILNLYALTYS